MGTLIKTNIVIKPFWTGSTALDALTMKIHLGSVRVSC